MCLVDKDNAIDTTYLDFSNEFDLVEHDIYIKKKILYGINGAHIRRIKTPCLTGLEMEFLMGRSQWVDFC